MRGVLIYPHFIDGEVQTLERESHLLKALSLGTERLRFWPMALHFQNPYPSSYHMAFGTAVYRETENLGNMLRLLLKYQQHSQFTK